MRMPFGQYDIKQFLTVIFRFLRFEAFACKPL